MDVCRESFFGGDFWLMHQYYRDSATHTPTIQQFGNPFIVWNLHESHLAVVSSLPSHYRYLLETDVLLDRTVVTVTLRCFQDSFAMIKNSIYTEAINRLLSTSSDITLNCSIWSTILKVWQKHNLKGARFILVNLLVSKSYSHRVYNPVGIGWHIE